MFGVMVVFGVWYFGVDGLLMIFGYEFKLCLLIIVVVGFVGGIGLLCFVFNFLMKGCNKKLMN